MKQQINLYQEQFHLKRVILPAVEIYALLGIGFVLLVLASVLLQVIKMNMSDVQTGLTQQQQIMQTNNQQLQKQINAHQVDPALQQAAADANRKLLARKKVLEWVRRSQAEDRVLFSDILAGLGRRHIEGLWLSTVSIDQKGGFMQLRGNTLQPELVPRFLSALKQEKAFTGTEFRKIKIEEQSAQSSILSFMLSTEPSEDGKVAVNRSQTRQ